MKNIRQILILLTLLINNALFSQYTITETGGYLIINLNEKQDTILDYTEYDNTSIFNLGTNKIGISLKIYSKDYGMGEYIFNENGDIIQYTYKNYIFKNGVVYKNNKMVALINYEDSYLIKTIFDLKKDGVREYRAKKFLFVS